MLLSSRQTNRPARGLTAIVGLLFLFSTLSTTLHAGEIALPEFGDPSGQLLTPAQEKRLGQAFMRSIRKTMVVIDDPLLSEYIEKLGGRLAASSDAAGRSFRFFLIDSPEINAFAGPGGHIGIYTGLVTTTETESELASVIAHEIAHISQNHMLRTYDAVNRLSLPLAALALAAVAIGAASNNPDLGVAAMAGMQAGLAQAQINFTRAHEEEADSIGIRTMADAEFDPRAMPVFFDRMGKSSRLYDSGELPEFLRTHPVTTNRIADSFGRADSYPYKQVADSLGYRLLRARLKVTSFNESKDAVTHFSETLEQKRYRDRESQQYGFVLALTADKKYADARRVLDELILGRPDQIEYIAADAEILAGAGRQAAALETLRKGLDRHPGSYPLSVQYAELLMDQNKPGEALALLETHQPGRPEDTGLYKLMGRAAGESGNVPLGHHYLAEYYYHSGNLELAAKQLQLALRDNTVEYYLSARMAARLKEIRTELMDLKEERK